VLLASEAASYDAGELFSDSAAGFSGTGIAAK